MIDYKVLGKRDIDFTPDNPESEVPISYKDRAYMGSKNHGIPKDAEIIVYFENGEFTGELDYYHPQQHLNFKSADEKAKQGATERSKEKEPPAEVATTGQAPTLDSAGIAEIAKLMESDPEKAQAILNALGGK